MSNVGVHDFAVPHEHVRPTRDMVIIQLPHPPVKVGSLIIPDMFRDMARHNIAAGRVVAMGPLAFTYKSMEGTLERQDVKIGDWVTIRPFAGTHVQGGKLQVGGGFRYVSSFQDIIGIVPFDKMPDPATLLWNEEDVPDNAPPAPKPAEPQYNAPRETVRIEKD